MDQVQKVQKRDGRIQDFDEAKIASAIEKAFLAGFDSKSLSQMTPLSPMSVFTKKLSCRVDGMETSSMSAAPIPVNE